MAEFKKCPWTTLGVEKAASEKQIREAYRKMALKYVGTLWFANRSVFLATVSFEH